MSIPKYPVHPDVDNEAPLISDKDIACCQRGSYRFSEKVDKQGLRRGCSLPEPYSCPLRREVWGKPTCISAVYYPEGFFEGRVHEELPRPLRPDVREGLLGLARERLKLVPATV